MRQYTRISPEKRFWTKVSIPVDKSQCWEWIGAKDPNGYGRFNLGGKKGPTILAHRFAYELANAGMSEGLHVCHRCDNPGCVNPSHLFLGTHQDNMKDMLEKGRSQHVPHPGEQAGNHKLTTSQVRIIRERYASGGVSQRQLAREFNVSQVQIGHIVRREQWQED